MDTTTEEGAPTKDPQAFKLRGGSFTLLVLQLTDLKDPNFFHWLLDKISQAPNFYRHAPVVLDLEGLAGSGPFNFAELARRLRQHQLVPVGVMNGTEEQNLGATNAGLSVFPMWRQSQQLEDVPAKKSAADEPADEPADKPADSAADQADERPPKEASRGGSKVINDPIRSGRQVYAQGGDLVVLNTVSAGAELLADGHIHVYGSLRGRALAGVSGQTSARIFCRSLQAELISVAGHWLVREDIDDKLIGRPVQIYLKDDFLVIEPLG